MVPNGVKLYGHGSQIVKCECKVSVFPVHEHSFTWFDMFRLNIRYKVRIIEFDFEIIEWIIKNSYWYV